MWRGFPYISRPGWGIIRGTPDGVLQGNPGGPGNLAGFPVGLGFSAWFSLPVVQSGTKWYKVVESGTKWEEVGATGARQKSTGTTLGGSLGLERPWVSPPDLRPCITRISTLAQKHYLTTILCLGLPTLSVGRRKGRGLGFWQSLPWSAELSVRLPSPTPWVP